MCRNYTMQTTCNSSFTSKTHQLYKIWKKAFYPSSLSVSKPDPAAATLQNLPGLLYGRLSICEEDIAQLAQIPLNLLCPEDIKLLWNLEYFKSALAGVAQWVECWLVNQRVAYSIPSQEHKPGLRARSPTGGAREATTRWCFSSSLLPSPSLKVNNKNKILKKIRYFK